jgi:excisionase family DNA binding protein
MYLTKKELAHKLRVSTMSINRWVDRGMPHLKTPQKVLFKEEEVVQWLKENFKKED